MKYPGNDIKIIEGWESVLARPGLYLRRKSLFGLECLVQGIGLTYLRCGPRPPDPFFKVDWYEFEQWARMKTHTRAALNEGTAMGPVRSFDLALEAAGGDDEAAFDIWADWFREFQGKK